MIFGEGGISILIAQRAKCNQNKLPSSGVARCLFQECLALGAIFNVKYCCFSHIFIAYLSNIIRKKQHAASWKMKCSLLGSVLFIEMPYKVTTLLCNGYVNEICPSGCIQIISLLTWNHFSSLWPCKMFISPIPFQRVMQLINTKPNSVHFKSMKAK
jgi:hypothetical protein